MPTLKLMLRKNKVRPDGSIPIVFRITENRKSTYKFSGYYVRPDQFRDGRVVKHPDAVLINSVIESMRSELMGRVVKATIERTPVFARAASDTVLKLMVERIGSYERMGKVSMFNKLSALRRVLLEAWGGDVPLVNLSPLHVQQFIEYRKQRGHHNSTIKKELSYLSAIVREHGGDPFKPASLKIRVEQPGREALSWEEIHLLENVKLSGLCDVARDMFLFSFYTHGMRFQNVATFKKSMIQGDVIRYRMNKGRAVRSVQVHAKLQAIIDKYNYTPYMFGVVKSEVKSEWEVKQKIGNANALINTRLKTVAARCGIDRNIHFHMARHTFAQKAMEKGVAAFYIKDALGHTSISTTQQYLRSLSDEQINDAVSGVYQ